LHLSSDPLYFPSDLIDIAFNHLHASSGGVFQLRVEIIVPIRDLFDHTLHRSMFYLEKKSQLGGLLLVLVGKGLSDLLKTVCFMGQLF